MRLKEVYALQKVVVQKNRLIESALSKEAKKSEQVINKIREKIQKTKQKVKEGE